MNINSPTKKSISTAILDLFGVHYECIENALAPSKLTVEISDSEAMQKKDLYLFVIKNPLRWYSTVFLVLLGVLYAGTFLRFESKKNCGDFSSKYEAQQAFNNDPVAYRGLDKPSKTINGEWKRNSSVCETYNYKPKS